MAESAAAGATPLLGNLPDEIVLWEILVRLDPKSLLRCRAVRRAWRCATSSRRFLLAHHALQPALPIVREYGYRNILSFDNRAAADAQLHTVAWLAEPFVLEASCEGLLVLSKYDCKDSSRTYLSVCNPATRQHASLGPLPDFNILGMYLHRPTGEYRLLLQLSSYLRSSKHQIGCYVFALGSDQLPRYIGCSHTTIASALFNVPAQLRDGLHWYPVYYPRKSNPVNYETASDPMKYVAESEMVIFDTIAESFRQIHAPVVPTKSCIFEMDNMLGIYSCNKATKIVDIWVLQNYESEVWDLKYRVELPIAQIRGKLEGLNGDGYWYVTVTSGDGAVLLLVSFVHWLFYVDTDGVLVASFHDFYACKHRFKQSLVLHDFFTTPEGCAVDVHHSSDAVE